MSDLTVDRAQLPGLCAAALDCLDRPVLVSDHQVVLFANVSAARVLHAESGSDLLGMPTEALSHPDSLSSAQMRRQLVADSGQNLSGVPTKIMAHDGTTVSTVTDVCPIEFDGQIAFVYTTALASDPSGLAGRRSVPEDHPSRREMFEAILEVIPDIVLIHDAEVILFANAACRRFLAAQSPGDLEDRPVDLIVHPDAYDAGRERRQLLLEGGRSIKNIPLKVIARDGQTKRVTVDAHPLELDGGFTAAAVIAQAPTL